MCSVTAVAQWVINEEPSAIEKHTGEGVVTSKRGHPESRPCIEEVREKLGPYKAGVGLGSLAKSGALPPRPLGSSMISPPRSPRATFAKVEAEGRLH